MTVLLQVVLSVDMGVGHSFNARVGLRNRFSFCDNMWHTVKATYIKDSLVLRVDNHQEAYGFNGSGDHEGAITGAELFIGGLPGKGEEGAEWRELLLTLKNIEVVFLPS